MRDWGAPRILVLSLACFALFGFYNRWWRYVSTRDMWSAARGVTAACIVSDLVVYLAHPVHGFQLAGTRRDPRLPAALGGVAGIRLVARTLIERPLPGTSSRTAGRC